MKNSEKRKFKKRKAREKDKKGKSPNKKYRFRLEAFVDDKWRAYELFSNKEEMESYVDSVEKVRKEGKTRIFDGRVIDLKTNKYVKFIERFDPMSIAANDLDDVKNIKSSRRPITNSAVDDVSQLGLKDD